MNKMYFYDKVKEFHLAFGQPAPSNCTATKYVVDRNLLNLRRRLMLEETIEILDAIVKHDLVEIMDGLADLIYVAAGTLVSYGYPPDLIEFYDCSTNQLLDSKSLDEQFNYFVGAAKRINLEETERDLCVAANDAIGLCLIANQKLCVSIVPIFDEVHSSNMAKLVDGKPLKRADGKIIKPKNWQPPNIKQFVENVTII